MPNPFRDAFQDRSVLVTGHTGFKGSWLCIWLRELGARVTGYSLDPPTQPNNFEASRLGERLTDLRGDVRELAPLRQAMAQHQPEIVFHLAAQPIVLESYRHPHETLHTNALGTVNLLEAVRNTQSVRAVVVVTTDKVYEDEDWVWSYRENDRLGGKDPYSASKAMAELAVAAYRGSFFSPERFSEHGVALASARAGNVIGGGDWAPYRLIPDCVRAFSAGEALHLRNPGHIRPWQHVLEALSGYLWLAARLLEEPGSRFAQAWNFGPDTVQGVTTEMLVQRVIELWGHGTFTKGEGSTERETHWLRLNWDKAALQLGWRPAYSWEQALSATVAWYQEYQDQIASGESVDMYPICVQQIQAYTDRARHQSVGWTDTEPYPARR